MPESCWVFSVVALYFCTFLLALSFVTCDMLDSVCMGNLRLFAFSESDCVFLHICDGLPHSLLCLFLISLSSFFFSVRAVIRCNAVHCNSSLTPPPHPPLAPSSTPLIMVLWGSAVVETWSPGVSGVALLSPKPVVDHV